MTAERRAQAGGSWRFAALLATLAMLGPFSIDTYLPSFPLIQSDLGADPLEVQQTMSAYLFAFALMMLWHGALSDALGRRPVILANLGVYAVATLGCAIAGNIQTLWLFRVLQGMSAGAGIVVGRAIVRDRFHGPEAQRVMSQITLVFGVAPAIAPIIGGALSSWFGWRSIFVVLLALTAAIFAWTTGALPETLPEGQRQTLRPRALLSRYGSVLGRREFLLLAVLLAFNFCGFFLYIASAPAFLMGHLGLGSRQFGWLFVPMVAGIMAGAFTSGRLAGRWPPQHTVRLGYAVMFAGAGLNLLIALLAPASAGWYVSPIPVYTFGSSLIMPSATLLILDLFPRARGLTSSLQSFVQLMLGTVYAGAIAPFLAKSLLLLAAGMLASALLSLCLWTLYRHLPVSSPR